jgi:hypothetical protein
MRTTGFCFLVVGSLILCACVPQRIQVAPLVVEPIHMTVDVTIHEQTDAAKPKAPESRPADGN